MVFVEFCLCVAVIILEMHMYIEISVKNKLDNEESLLSDGGCGKKLVDPLKVYTHIPNSWLNYDAGTE